MGYSCTQKADRSLKYTLAKAVGLNPEKDYLSNTWTNNGKKYFYEQGKENEDGAITCQVMQIVGEGCKRAGSMRIEADGTITRWDGMPKKYWHVVDFRIPEAA